MISEVDITRFTKVITSHVEAKQIILFGSYAQKTMKSDSDIDILILVNYSGCNLITGTYTGIYSKIL